MRSAPGPGSLPRGSSPAPSASGRCAPAPRPSRCRQAPSSRNSAPDAAPNPGSLTACGDCIPAPASARPCTRAPRSSSSPWPRRPPDSPPHRLPAPPSHPLPSIRPPCPRSSGAAAPERRPEPTPRGTGAADPYPAPAQNCSYVHPAFPYITFPLPARARGLQKNGRQPGCCGLACSARCLRHLLRSPPHPWRVNSRPPSSAAVLLLNPTTARTFPPTKSGFLPMPEESAQSPNPTLPLPPIRPQPPSQLRKSAQKPNIRLISLETPRNLLHRSLGQTTATSRGLPSGTSSIPGDICAKTTIVVNTMLGTRLRRGKYS